MMYKYPYPKPPWPPQMIGFFIISGVGVVALWMAANEAFKTVVSPEQAALAATVVEAGAFIEAVSLVIYKHWGYLVPVIIMAAVSISLNLTQVIEASTNLSWYQFPALALGPLVSSLCVYFAFGYAYSNHQLAVVEWQENKTAWEIGKQKEAETEARRLADAKLSRRQVIEDEQRADQKAAAKRAENRKARQETAARKLKQQSEALPESVPVTTGSGAEVAKVLPEWIDRMPESEADFIAMAKSGEARLDGASGPKLAAIMGKSPRTNQKLLNKAKAAIKANGHKEMA